MVGYLVLLPKRFEVQLFNGGNEVVYRPQGKYYKVLESVRAYDGLGWVFNTN